MLRLTGNTQDWSLARWLYEISELKSPQSNRSEMFVRSRTSFNTKHQKPAQPGTTCLPVGLVIWDHFISFVRLKLWEHVIWQKLPGQRRPPWGLSAHRARLATKMAPHSGARLIYSSHLLFLQTVTAGWVSRESDEHKSARVSECILGARRTVEAESETVGSINQRVTVADRVMR